MIGIVMDWDDAPPASLEERVRDAHDILGHLRELGVGSAFYEEVRRQL